jgi:gp16 family phage-associated protein
MELRQAKEVRELLARDGVSVSRWARANNLDPMVVYAVLSGRHKGTRGAAHNAAVLLGLKAGRALPEGAEKNVLAGGSQ